MAGGYMESQRVSVRVNGANRAASAMSCPVFLVRVKGHFDPAVLRAAGRGVVRRNETAAALGLYDYPGGQ